MDNAAALRLYGGTEIEVPRSLSTGARPTGMINLGLALIECGALDPNTAALTMGEAVEAVQKALQAYFAGLDAGGEFSFSVSATIEDDKLVLDLSPVDSGILLAPALALEEIPYAWRKRSYDLILKALNLGAGCLDCKGLAEYHRMMSFDGAETDAEAKEWLRESYGVDDEEEFAGQILPSELEAAMPALARAETDEVLSEEELANAPTGLAEMWRLLDLALAAIDDANPAFAFETDALPANMAEEIETQGYEPGFCLAPVGEDEGPWFQIYDQLYQYWFQGDARFCTAILVASTPSEIAARLRSLERGAAVLKAVEPLIDYWMKHPSVADDDDTQE